MHPAPEKTNNKIPPTRLELITSGLGILRSIRVSYGGILS